MMEAYFITVAVAFLATQIVFLTGAILATRLLLRLSRDLNK